jgi:hypothetical protein
MIVHRCPECDFTYDDDALEHHRKFDHCDPNADPLDRLSPNETPLYQVNGGYANYAHEPAWNAATGQPVRQPLVWVARARAELKPKARAPRLPTKKIEPLPKEEASHEHAHTLF